MKKLGAKELRTTKSTAIEKTRIKKNPIYIILDSVLDTYNVGAIFRLAEAVAAEKVFLCGMTETPPNTRIKKASINTTEWVDWEYFDKNLKAIEYLRESVPDIKIYSVEQDAKSTPFGKFTYSFPCALVVGNETTGVSQEVLEQSDAVLEIPMWGINKSLNVMVSLGIVLFKIMEFKT